MNRKQTKTKAQLQAQAWKEYRKAIDLAWKTFNESTNTDRQIQIRNAAIIEAANEYVKKRGMIK